MNKQTVEMINRLQTAGISTDDAFALRRIAMTLHRWFESECGDGNDRASWCITRGRKENGAFVYDENGAPYEERHVHANNKTIYTRLADRERGAERRLAKIMVRYPGFQAFIQGDPRGAALYILRPGDVPPETDMSGYYTRGIAVYK